MARKTQISKEVILQKALEMLISDGYSSINIKTLSQEIGCSTQPLVWHFENMDGLRTALAEYALNYANNKMAPTAENAIDAFAQVGVAYVRLAMREPNLFKFLYMNGDSRFSFPNIDTLKSYDSHDELVKRISATYGISEEAAGRYLEHTIIYTHGVATMLAAGVVKASEEEAMKMVYYAGHSFAMREGIRFE